MISAASSITQSEETEIFELSNQCDERVEQLKALTRERDLVGVKLVKYFIVIRR